MTLVVDFFCFVSLFDVELDEELLEPHCEPINYGGVDAL